MEFVLIGFGAAAFLGVVGIFGLGYISLCGGASFWPSLLPSLAGAAAVGVMIASALKCLEDVGAGWPLNREGCVTSFYVALVFFVWPIACFQLSRLVGLWIFRWRFVPSYVIGLIAFLALLAEAIPDPLWRKYLLRNNKGQTA